LKVATIEETTVEDFDKPRKSTFAHLLSCAAAPSDPVEGKQHRFPLVARGGAPLLEQPAYAATRPIDTWWKHFASILGPRGIRVNAVAPGVVETTC